MEKLIKEALVIELRQTKSMLSLIGMLALLRSLGQIPETMFKHAIEIYISVQPQAFDITKKKLEYVLEVEDYNWWMPEFDRERSVWYAKACPCQFSTAFEAPDEEAANIYIEKVLEYKTT